MINFQYKVRSVGLGWGGGQKVLSRPSATALLSAKSKKREIYLGDSLSKNGSPLTKKSKTEIAITTINKANIFRHNRPLSKVSAKNCQNSTF
jgi:hypothetical protein